MHSMETGKETLKETKAKLKSFLSLASFICFSESTRRGLLVEDKQMSRSSQTSEWELHRKQQSTGFKTSREKFVNTFPPNDSHIGVVLYLVSKCYTGNLLHNKEHITAEIQGFNKALILL